MTSLRALFSIPVKCLRCKFPSFLSAECQPFPSPGKIITELLCKTTRILGCWPRLNCHITGDKQKSQRTNQSQEVTAHPQKGREAKHIVDVFEVTADNLRHGYADQMVLVVAAKCNVTKGVLWCLGQKVVEQTVVRRCSV